jgi:hypothetical protein
MIEYEYEYEDHDGHRYIVLSPIVKAFTEAGVEDAFCAAARLSLLLADDIKQFADEAMRLKERDKHHMVWVVKKDGETS